MKLKLSPQVRPHHPVYERRGDVLVVDGEDFDFTDLPDGATIYRFSPDDDENYVDPIDCEVIVGNVRRANGVLEITIIVGYTAPGELFQQFPEPIIDPPDGVIDVPVDTRVEVEREPSEDGSKIKVTTTTYRWHQEPEEVITFEKGETLEVKDAV